MVCSLCMAAVVVVLTLVPFWRSYRRRLMVDGRHNKAVFITGCDSGFGLALARRLDSKGVPVFAGCFSEEAARKLKEMTSSRLKVILVDVTNRDTIHNAREFIEGSLPKGCSLWGIVNNAGIFEGEGSTEYFTLTDYRKHMEVNFFVAKVWHKMYDDAVDSFDKVIDDYEHALFAVHPRAHYNPDKSAKLLVALSYLPEFVLDHAFKPLYADPIFIPRCLTQQK